MHLNESMLERPLTDAETYFAQRRQNPAYNRAYRRAWRGLNPDPALKARILTWLFAP